MPQEDKLITDTAPAAEAVQNPASQQDSAPAEAPTNETAAPVKPEASAEAAEAAPAEKPAAPAAEPKQPAQNRRPAPSRKIVRKPGRPVVYKKPSRVVYVHDRDTPVIEREERRQPADYSRGYVTREGYLISSDPVQKYFERHYNRMDYSFSVIMSVIPMIKEAEKREECRTKLETLFKTLEDVIDTANKALVNEMRAHGYKKNEMAARFDHKREYTPPMRTPCAGRYLKIVEQYDQLVARVEALWIRGDLPGELRLQSLDRFSVLLNRFATDINQLRIHSIECTRSGGRWQEAHTVDEQSARATPTEMTHKDVPMRERDVREAK